MAVAAQAAPPIPSPSGLTPLVSQLRSDESIMTLLVAEAPKDMQRFIASLDELEALYFTYNWEYQVRPMQIRPTVFGTWVIQGGRGVGKTRPGSQCVIDWAKSLGKDYGGGKIALIAKDPGDARDVMIEGESGILPCSPPYFRPRYEPSRRRLSWDNGVTAHIYSSEVPDDLRGPQHHKGWGDEICKWKHAQETWDQYQLGLRLGADPQTVITTTPRPIKVYLEIINDPETVVTRGKTDDNYANLSEKFIKTVYRKYKGTRLGRQELDAELLTDTPGALWTLDMIDATRVSKAPDDLIYIVVAIDPGVTDPDPTNPQFTEGHAETGIVVCARGADGHGYVLHDFSGSLSADEWGQKSVTHFTSLQADMIVGEVNNGGDLVEFVIKAAAEKLEMTYTYEKVHASRGKRTRAEPVSALYEQKRQHHVGAFPDLEDQMTTWIPGMKSPDRMDAMVWGSTKAMLLFEKERPNVLRGRAVW